MDPIMAFWLMKSERTSSASTTSPQRPADHGLVRRAQFQARNFMLSRCRSATKSSSTIRLSEPHCRNRRGVVAAYPDATSSTGKPYFDREAKRESPRWFNVDVRSSGRPG